MITRAVAALEAIEHLGTQELGVQELLEQIMQRVAQVVEVDAFFAAATDPETGHCLGAGVVRDMADDVFRPLWEHEFLVPDFNKFADLTPAEPVADLREATGGRLSRSARHRTLRALSGLEDELRAVFCAGGRSWGVLQLNRRDGEAPFIAADMAFLRALAPVAGCALRRALLGEPVGTDPLRGPGVALIDAHGTILTATAEAQAWLEELSSGWRRGGIGLLIHPDLLMLSVRSLEHGAAPRRVRLRTEGGTWLIAQASPLAGTEQVALVIEPAKASEILPIVVEAYGLTPREVEVCRLVARGLSTEEVAAALFLSRHTVRDHVKAVFEKVGVCSRGQLTSKLFAEHYESAQDGRSGRDAKAAAVALAA